MHYWSWFAGKLAVSGLASCGLLRGMHALWTAHRRFRWVDLSSFGIDLWYTLAVLMWFLVSCGLVALCVRDQRYRCRVCLRRLRMPVETGSWSYLLQLGRPRTEYICTYGHGRLNVAELQISGAENPEWTPQGDMWAELMETGRERGKDGGR